MSDSTKLNIIFWIVLIVTMPIWVAMLAWFVQKAFKGILAVMFFPAAWFRSVMTKRSERYWGER